MIELQVAARKNRDFAEFGRIRDELALQGVILEESREGTARRIER